MSKLIVFDVDGTFVNSWPAFEKIVLAYTNENNLPQPCLETLRVGYGAPEEHQFWPGLPQEDQKTHLFNTFAMIDNLRPEGSPAEDMPALYDGVLETMTRLKDLNHTLAIVTAKPYEPLIGILDFYDIEKHFCAMRTHNDVKNRGERMKPYPDQLLSVMSELDFSTRDTVMIGDTDMDMNMANAAGVDAIGVTWGNHCQMRLNKAGAAHIVEDEFHQIVDTVDLIFKAE